MQIFNTFELSAKRTFPNKYLAIGTVVQDKAVSGLQFTLGKRVLFSHQSDRHSPTGIWHL